MAKQTPSNLMFSLRLNVALLTEVKLEIATELKDLRSVCKHPRVFFLRREHHPDHGICVNCGTHTEGDVFKTFKRTKSRKFFVPHSPGKFYQFKTIFENSYPTHKQVKDVGLNLTLVTS